jgi:hypothetical protein
MQDRMRQRFKGQFHSLSGTGSKYVNQERFWPLRNEGKPLWEFKEHDHRLYCCRVLKEQQMIVVLFNGWVKDKEGKAKQEKREIQKALDLYAEFIEEFNGGGYDVLDAVINKN